MKIYLKYNAESEKYALLVTDALQKSGHGVFTRTRRQILADLGLTQKSRRNFIYHYWKPAWNLGLIDFAYPGSPNKPEQAYRLTAKGLDLYAQLIGE